MEQYNRETSLLVHGNTFGRLEAMDKLKEYSLSQRMKLTLSAFIFVQDREVYIPKCNPFTKSVKFWLVIVTFLPLSFLPLVCFISCSKKNFSMQQNSLPSKNKKQLSPHF